ncbi:hypothetical protein J1N35_023149 [Gossypium stocksii]|uniref:RNase H type-1 domain-containing protein n=1 Tax=Gossypium stocksii TaxID=47602 RepID=A0A9D3VI95_9ROSI|nr:hypothetical protein J1N35_023149 [Gossypium stocksii]
MQVVPQCLKQDFTLSDANWIMGNIRNRQDYRHESRVALIIRGNVLAALAAKKFIKSINVAGAGGLIRDSNGNWIAGFSRFIGSSMPLQAELWGIADGMKLAWDLRYRKLVMEIDSSIALDLLGDVNAINSPLSMIRSSNDLRNRPWEVIFCKIYREANRAAPLQATWHQFPSMKLLVFTDSTILLQEFRRC